MIRTLNTAQLLSLSRGSPLKLITFDGDVTLYDDGHSLTPDNPVISRILRLLSQGIKVGIVTAAGYTDSIRYYERLHGLLEAIKAAFGNSATSTDRPSLVILGGESQYLYALDFNSVNLLKCVPRVDWMLPQMKSWSDMDINALLDVAEGALQECVTTLGLSATIIRKERAVGIIPTSDSPDHRFSREQLEETVLVTQQKVEMLAPSVPFCAFNGGNDVFVDIGDKSWGVLACQNYFGKITGAETLHVGDQFLSAGANDFKARLVCTTAWIANPTETVQLLDEMQFHSSVRAKKEEVKEEDDTEDFEEERL